MLLHDDGARDQHVAPVTTTLEIACAEHATSREVLAIEAHDLWPRRDAGDPVVESRPLLVPDRRKCRCRGRGQRQSPPYERWRRAMRVARAPQQSAPRLAE